MKDDLRLIKGQETKKKILNAALVILAKEGFDGLSTKKISDEAGISKSNVFHHYSSVDEIMASLFTYLTEIMFTPLEEKRFLCLEDFFKALGENTFNLKPEEELAFTALFQYYNMALINNDYRERLIEMKEIVMKTFKTSILSIEPVNEKRLEEIIENIVITLDAMGMYHLMEKDVSKFTRLWHVQSSMYCSYLRG